jgi:hypothetical protein
MIGDPVGASESFRDGVSGLTRRDPARRALSTSPAGTERFKLCRRTEPFRVNLKPLGGDQVWHALAMREDSE